MNIPPLISRSPPPLINHDEGDDNDLIPTILNKDNELEDLSPVEDPSVVEDISLPVVDNSCFLIDPLSSEETVTTQEPPNCPSLQNFADLEQIDPSIDEKLNHVIEEGNISCSSSHHEFADVTNTDFQPTPPHSELCEESASTVIDGIHETNYSDQIEKNSFSENDNNEDFEDSDPEADSFSEFKSFQSFKADYPEDSSSSAVKQDTFPGEPNSIPEDHFKITDKFKEPEKEDDTNCFSYEEKSSGVLEGIDTSNVCLNEFIKNSNVWASLSQFDSTPALHFKWNISYSNCKFLGALKMDSRNILSAPWNINVGMKGFSFDDNKCHEGSGCSTVNDCKTRLPVPQPHFDWVGSGLVNPLDGAARGCFPQIRRNSVSMEAANFLKNLPNLSFLQQNYLVFPSYKR